MISETPVLDRLIIELESLLQLAQERELGLHTWHDAMARQIDRCRDYLLELRPMMDGPFGVYGEVLELRESVRILDMQVKNLQERVKELERER